MNAQAVIFLGAPGAGKGTQAREVARKFRIPQISTGDILRDAVRRQTPLGMEAKAKMEAGTLVPDAVVCGIIEERLGEPDCANGFVLDGFPRTILQGEFLERMLEANGWGKPSVVNIKVGSDILLKRLVGRRNCPTCGEIYNVYFNPPKNDMVCDRDGTPLVQRSDDNEDTIRQRFLAYEKESRPLIDYYRRQNLLKEVDGSGDSEAVSKKVCALLKQV